jgi:2-polyprenyl-3-methyl-5-hydroxy-6-metoxy-1,4-benzoquinol methylase
MAVIDSIDDNLTLTGTPESIDQINSGFYSKFPFPWRPRSLDYTSDPDLARVMLNQNLGDWKHQMVPPDPHVWVAGCGTNQAAITALHFRQAAVLGSDISTSSLELCASTARDLGCGNLELRNESINQTDYRQQFDYVICTGVIHHNADPEATLRKLAAALKPSGVLELMVYNRYHRILSSAFQKGVRLLGEADGASLDFEREFAITRLLIENFPGQGLMRQFVSKFKESPAAEIADALMQPVENSYTVEVLEEMAGRCGLEFVAPSPNAWDRASGHGTWNMRFAQAEIQKPYDQLPDSQRWQITNLLLCEQSPLLWFYLKRKDSPTSRKTEQEICDSFLQARFQPTAVTRRAYILNRDNKFAQTTSALPYPGAPARREIRQIVEAMGNGASMEQVMNSLHISREFSTVNDLRLRLTTSANPYLRSIP